jgi:Ca2+-binding EF-hand superfamily protein
MSSIGGISIGSLQFLASHKQRLATGADAGAGRRFEAARSGSEGAEVCDSLGVRCSPKALDALIALQEHGGGGDAGAVKCGTGATTTLVDRLLEKFDADGDGAITKTELEAAFAARDANATRAGALFGKLDADGDGKISKDELKDAFGLAAGLAERLFARLDADGDGKISEAEFEAAFAAHSDNAKRAEILFTRPDADGDGAISQSELAAAIEHRRHRHDHDGVAAAERALAALTKAAASSETTTAADGTTTTVLAFADGTKVTVTKPATDGETA